MVELDTSFSPTVPIDSNSCDTLLVLHLIDKNIVM